jgi:hypothetical protein
MSKQLTTASTIRWTELAHRVSDGVDVTLVWVHGNGVDETVVSVYDTRQGTYFELTVEAQNSLDAFHHPLAYRDVGRVSYEESRVAA